MVLPAITDVTMEALCPGRDECSVAIYLSGFQSAITGLGALVVTPVVGNLSDKYGRKALMTLPVTVAILPLFILACNRSDRRSISTSTSWLRSLPGSSVTAACLSLAYVADQVGAKRRAAAFGLLSGVSAAGFVAGTLAARFLPTSSTFQVAAAVATAGAIYFRAFVPDSGAGLFGDEACDPLLQDSSCSSDTSSSTSSDEELSPRLPAHKGVLPSLPDITAVLVPIFFKDYTCLNYFNALPELLLLTLSGAATVTFFYSLGEHGLQSGLLYYLKARFGYSKDEFANLMLIAGAAGMLSQLTVMPIFAPIVGEEILLIVGLLGGCTHVFLYGIAWSSWVPYFSASFVILSAFVHPSIRTNVSRSVGSNEQGIAQGCISGITSFANILAPLIFTPLTAWCLSERELFNFKGFSIMCAGFCTLIAFVIGIRMRGEQCKANEKSSIVQHEQA